MAAQTLLDISPDAPPIPTLFGSQDVRVADLVRMAPHLAVHLSLTSASAIHSVAAFLDANAAAGASLETSAEIIATCAPSFLLERVLPGHHPSLFSTLDRVVLPAWTFENIAALDEVLRSDIADLIHWGGITVDDLACARAILRAHPVIRRVRASIPDLWTREHLTAVLVWLQEHEALHHLAKLPDGTGKPALARGLRCDLASLCAPQCPFSIPHGWTHLSTPEALWSAGADLRNCLAVGSQGGAAHLLGLLAGTDVYVRNEDGPFVAHLRHLGGRVWSLVCIFASGGQAAGEDEHRRLIAALKRDGIMVIDVALEAALDNLLTPTRDMTCPSNESTLRATPLL